MKDLTDKDLLYLKDIFNWNYTQYKNISHYRELVSEDFCEIFDDALSLFNNNMNTILDILGGNI